MDTDTIAPPRRCPRCGGKPDKGITTCPVCELSITDPEARVDTKAKAGAVREFFRGLVYFPKGFYFLASNGSLWKVAVIPIIMNVALLALSFFAAWEIQEWLTQGLMDSANQWTGIVWGKIMWGVVKILVFIAKVIPLLLIPLIVAWLFALFGKFLFMPFMEILSESTERLFLGHVVEEDFSFKRFSSDLLVSLFDAILLTLAQIFTYIVLLPLNFVPVLGNILWFLIPGCLFASMDYTDMNFVRRRYNVDEKIKIWNQNRWRFIGFGFTFFTLLSIPWVNIITGSLVVPVACVGGTLLFLELDTK